MTRQSSIGGGIAVIGLAFAGVAWWLRRSDRMQGQLRDVEIDRRLRGRSEIEAELREAEAGLAQHLGTLGMADLAEAEDLLGREEAHVAQIDRLEAQLDGLVGKEPRRDAATPCATPPRSRSNRRRARSRRSGRSPRSHAPASASRSRSRIPEDAVGRARDDEANARARVEANAVDAEQVAGQAERLAVWREQLSALERRQRVYAATLAAIDRAEQATMKTATRYLEAHMVRDLAPATDGRYRRVRVDDRTLDIEVYAPERGDWVPVSALSQGTLDLVYLIARLGLVRLVTGDRRPPLVFDDPFVTLDDARAARALELLKSIAADFQVIYLTTSDRYDARSGRRGGAPRADGRRQRAGGTARLIDPLGAEAVTIVLGLVAALTWGSGDFAGGMLSRRAPVLGVVLVSQLVGTVLALAIAILRGETLPLLSDVPLVHRRGTRRWDRDRRALSRAGGRPDGRRGAGDRGARRRDPGGVRDGRRGAADGARGDRHRARDRRGRPRFARRRRPRWAVRARPRARFGRRDRQLRRVRSARSATTTPSDR